MIHHRAMILVAFGFLAGLLANVVWTQGSALPQAAAQAPAAKAELPHYQITSWAYPGFARGSGVENPKYGAYILDSITGEVWVVKEDNSPRTLGKVAK